MTNREIIDALHERQALSFDAWVQLLRTRTEDDCAYAAQLARTLAQQRFGKQIYFRGVIEFTNYCKNDCYYCGIRHENTCAARYRLTQGDILACCEDGYAHGFRTFVLQGGEDPYFTDERLVAMVSAIRARFADCAITLSVGERSRASYQRLFDAGANRYLLRHETADAAHYAQLHPADMLWAHRMQCLRDLKDIGY
ncbi:MAG: [FeFe] hydrogenase H-cluster radical SAM maturase HydE, partial [Ruthenibacterium sp.]